MRTVLLLVALCIYEGLCRIANYDPPPIEWSWSMLADLHVWTAFGLLAWIFVGDAVDLDCARAKRDWYRAAIYEIGEYEEEVDAAQGGKT